MNINLQLIAWVGLIFFSAPAVGFNLTSEHHDIPFSKVKPTAYTLKTNRLNIQVDKSASALLYPFKQIKTIYGVSFNWKVLSGVLNKTTASSEKTKSEDDFYLRIGLILSGSKPWVPFFAPSWIKLTEKHLIHPSNQMLYLLPKAKSPFGTSWQSPYSSSIRQRVIKTTTVSKTTPAMLHSTWTSKNPVKIVGLWVLADGDNTKSTFSVSLEKLDLILRPLP